MHNNITTNCFPEFDIYLQRLCIQLPTQQNLFNMVSFSETIIVFKQGHVC